MGITEAWVRLVEEHGKSDNGDYLAGCKYEIEQVAYYMGDIQGNGKKWTAWNVDEWKVHIGDVMGMYSEIEAKLEKGR